jgi:hypothetical protein
MCGIMSLAELRAINMSLPIAAQAGTTGLFEYLFEELAHIPTEIEYASEFRYRNPLVDMNTLVLTITQSGETAECWGVCAKPSGAGTRCSSSAMSWAARGHGNRTAEFIGTPGQELAWPPPKRSLASYRAVAAGIVDGPHPAALAESRTRNHGV